MNTVVQGNRAACFAFGEAALDVLRNLWSDFCARFFVVLNRQKITQGRAPLHPKDVPPSFSVADCEDRRFVQPVFLSKGWGSCASNAIFSHLDYERIRQFCACVRSTLRHCRQHLGRPFRVGPDIRVNHAALSGGVLHVVGVGSEKEVSWVHAMPNVAVVANVGAGRNCRSQGGIGKTMGVDALPVDGEGTVPVWPFRSAPKPASAGLINHVAAVETLNIFCLHRAEDNPRTNILQ